MFLLKVLLMIAAGIGAAVGMRSSKNGEGPGRIIAIACAIFALLLAISSLITGKDRTPRMVKSMGSYSYASGVVLGRHLAETHNGSRALILIEPVFDKGEKLHELQQGMIEGLEDGMGSALEIAATVPADPPPAYVERALGSWGNGMDPPPGMSTNSIPMLMRDYIRWYDVRYFANLLETHKGTYDVVISTIGLPKGFSSSKLARSPEFPDFALLSAPGERLGGLIKAGVVDVAVADKSLVNLWKTIQNAPSDVDEAFDKRYVLVTKENLAEVVAAYPDSPHWR